MRIQLRSDERVDDESNIIADFDAPIDDAHGLVVGGPLGGTVGNLYIFIDGVECGSLFFYRDAKGDSVSLGTYTGEPEWDWEPKATIYAPTEDKED